MKYRTILTAVVGLGLIAASAPADMLTWTGAADAQWHNALNWNPDALEPQAGDTVRFGADASGDNILVTGTNTNKVLMEVLADAVGGVTFTGDSGSRRIELYADGGAEATPNTVFHAAAGAGPVTFDVEMNLGNPGYSKWVNESASTVTFRDRILSFASRAQVFSGGDWRFQTNNASFTEANLVDGAVVTIERTNALQAANLYGDAGTSIIGDASNPDSAELSVRAAGLYSGAITGKLAVSKGRNNFNDADTLELAGSNTYTGTTTVNTGTLLVSGSHTGGGAYLVTGSVVANQDPGRTGGGILAGNGSIDIGVNDLTVSAPDATGLLDKNALPLPQPYAAIAPGNSVGTLAVAAHAVVFGDYSQLDAEVDGLTADLLAITGDLDLSSTLDRLNVLDLGNGSFEGSPYTLVTFTGSRIGTFDQVLGLDGTGYSVVYDDLAGQVRLEIPEPTSVGLITLGVAGLALRRRAR